MSAPTFPDPQSAAMAWAEEHGWGAEAAENPELGLRFFFTTPAQGRRPAQQVTAGYFSSWATFAGRLMTHNQIVKTDDGWEVR